MARAFSIDDGSFFFGQLFIIAGEMAMRADEGFNEVDVIHFVCRLFDFGELARRSQFSFVTETPDAFQANQLCWLYHLD